MVPAGNGARSAGALVFAAVDAGAPDWAAQAATSSNPAKPSARMAKWRMTFSSVAAATAAAPTARRGWRRERRDVGSRRRRRASREQHEKKAEGGGGASFHRLDSGQFTLLPQVERLKPRFIPASS
jgi:hypothetical protein